MRKILLVLSRELHRPLFEVMTWPENEIINQIAYNLTQNEDWQKEYERQRIASLPMKERVAMAKAMMSGSGE
ncbi:hypothetical protein [Snodgrassella alvi]|uniref:hypothetical protein n=1 Tax=Snodgrassella alvi TaxID=1196083 RepID=UPI00117B4B19|nr:hypothetical protein [Snodgrassella alvi]